MKGISYLILHVLRKLREINFIKDFLCGSLIPLFVDIGVSPWVLRVFVRDRLLLIICHNSRGFLIKFFHVGKDAALSGRRSTLFSVLKESLDSGLFGSNRLNL